MQHPCTPLIHHISRIEGQLASIKKELQQNNPDCIKASKTLYSLSRSFAGFRQKFIQTFLQRYATFHKETNTDEALVELLKLIKS